MLENKMSRKSRTIIRHFPNCLTILRFAGAALLMVFAPASMSFMVIYTFCGVTDVLDGLLARKLQAESQLGAALDSTADFVFVIAAFFKFAPVIALPFWAWIWLGAILTVKLVSLGLHFRKSGCFGFLHSRANRVTGLLLFFAPLTVGFANICQIAGALEIVATYAALQELWWMWHGPYNKKDERLPEH